MVSSSRKDICVAMITSCFGDKIEKFAGFNTFEAMKKRNFSTKIGKNHDGMSCFCGAKGKYKNWHVVYRDVIECTTCGKIWIASETLEVYKIKRPEVRSFGPQEKNSAPSRHKKQKIKEIVSKNDTILQ